MTKTFRIDIDETICITSSDRDYANAEPMMDRIVKVNQLYDEGNIIIYWTSRGVTSGIDWTDITKKQLLSWGCKFHEVYCDKPYYDLFVCDKAINSNLFFE